MCNQPFQYFLRDQFGVQAVSRPTNIDLALQVQAGDMSRRTLHRRLMSPAYQYHFTVALQRPYGDMLQAQSSSASSEHRLPGIFSCRASMPSIMRPYFHLHAVHHDMAICDEGGVHMQLWEATNSAGRPTGPMTIRKPTNVLCAGGRADSAF